MRAYIENTMGGFGSATPRRLNLAGGAELEYNQALNHPADRVPLRLFAGAEPEKRTKTVTDTTMRPRRWVDRLFADTAAENFGIQMETIDSGTASFSTHNSGRDSGAARP